MEPSPIYIIQLREQIGTTLLYYRLISNIYQFATSAILAILQTRHEIQLLHQKLRQLNKMGNQQSNQFRTSMQRRSRYRTLQFKDNSKINSSRRYVENINDDQVFTTPPINRSMAIPNQEEQDQYSINQVNKSKNNIEEARNYYSIDVNQQRKGARSVRKSQKDKVLESLSRKNEQLRKQLKQISEQLTKRLKRKKLVPKKNKNQSQQSQNQYDKQTNEKQLMGLKRQLQNGYKQIQMYKKTIASLKSKEQGISADHRVNVLQNDIVIKDAEIQKLIKKIEGIKKIKGKQDEQIELDINDDMRTGVDTYKRQLEQLKGKLKQFANRDRAREGNYKKQQAYLCDLQKKMRQLDGSYFPDLNNHIKKQNQKTAASDKEKNVNPKQYLQVAEQARLLRIKHQQYNRKIQALLQLRNKRIQEQNDMKDQVVYKQRIIEALKIKIATIQKLLKPRRKNLFGIDGQQGSELQSQFNDNESEIQRQLQQELNQDQFDIKHLIANIPKPVRKRPQQISNGYSSGGSSNGQRKKGPGMIITSQKAQPKKWGAISTRTQERGKHFKGQLSFEDRGQFDGDVQPLIVGVNIWVNNNNVILGIQAIYLNNNQLRYGAKSSDSAQGIIRRFDLQSPDYLKNLTLSIGKQGFVQSMTLYSKQGKVGKFGNKRSQDQSVNFGLASNQRPFMFLGATTLYQKQPRLNFFGLQICNQ